MRKLWLAEILVVPSRRASTYKRGLSFFLPIPPLKSRRSQGENSGPNTKQGHLPLTKKKYHKKSLPLPGPPWRRRPPITHLTHQYPTMVDNTTCTERLHVLLTQEATHYRTTDYLTRMQADRENTHLSNLTAGVDQEDLPGTKRRKSAATTTNSTDDLPSSNPEQATSNGENNRQRNNIGASFSTNGRSDGSSSSPHINKHWREKICEWAYQGKIF